MLFKSDPQRVYRACALIGMVPTLACFIRKARWTVPELDTAEGVAGELGRGGHASGVAGLSGGLVVGAAVW